MKKSMFWTWIRAEVVSVVTITIILPMLLAVWSMDYMEAFKDDLSPVTLIIELVGSFVLLVGFTVGAIAQAYWYWRATQE